MSSRRSSSVRCIKEHGFGFWYKPLDRYAYLAAMRPARMDTEEAKKFAVRLFALIGALVVFGIGGMYVISLI